MIKLIFESGSLKGRRMSVEEDRVTIGRAQGNDIQILDENVSRHHCVIEKRGKVWYIKDLGTTNGTFVNGLCVKEREIAPRDCIRIGEVFFTIQKSADGDEDTSIIIEDAKDGVFEEMRKGKGYNTILAETVGEAKKKDYVKILENKPPNVDTIYYLKKSFKNLGYTSAEADALVKEATGINTESFPQELVVEVQQPKYNELIVITSERIVGIQVSRLTRHQNQDYLVLDINEDPESGNVVYRLKQC